WLVSTVACQYTSQPEVYTLSLHDALPILSRPPAGAWAGRWIRSSGCACARHECEWLPSSAMPTFTYGQLATIARSANSRTRETCYMTQAAASADKPQRLKLTSTERRASIMLALLFASRMLGLFLLTPVFAVAAQAIPGGNDAARVG